MHVHPVALKGGSGQRHPVFPAVQDANIHAADSSGAKSGTVSGAPTETLFVGWNEFSMVVDEMAVGVDPER